jgi:hypothetical protein
MPRLAVLGVASHLGDAGYDVGMMNRPVRIQGVRRTERRVQTQPPQTVAVLPTLYELRPRSHGRASEAPEFCTPFVGTGIGICQTAIARRDAALVHVLTSQFSLPLETWITMHQDLRNSPRCKVTFEALVEGLQRHIG